MPAYHVSQKQPTKPKSPKTCISATLPQKKVIGKNSKLMSCFIIVRNGNADYKFEKDGRNARALYICLYSLLTINYISA